ncbi:Stage II sporulation protein P (SpoIIP) [Neomoorella glycerini]|uniref:Stage II sporulation protein P (SpoIIP) n=1 Tax=Neomoorella glycerini TaxID=55779 RepID=A0A6I5ZSB3_9FIRM|nr:stage II sporulation protein P [Moorella glycerini]QGP92485.1 Stage II sporulation protein P (SpoIIP) [Moorella glycerini]
MATSKGAESLRIHVITRWQARIFLSRLVKVFVAVAVILSLATGTWRLIKAGRQLSPGVSYSAWLPLPLLEGILSEGLPTLALRAASSPQDSSSKNLAAAARVLASPLVVFPGSAGVTPLLTTEEEYELPPPLPGESAPPAPAEREIASADNPLVAIYNTHNAESYQPSEGQAKFPGKNGGVSQVAAVLAETLSKDYGIPVVRSTTIHDYPDFTRSYANSEKTLKRMLAENPSVLVALDIHRNAGLPAPPVVEIAHQKVAQVLIIVGSNARLEHPNWRQNEAFAHQLAKKMDELYPGLCLGVRVQEGRYNQHLLPRALLLEVGSDNNTLEEAERSARLIARVLAGVIEDLRRENPAQSG